MFFEEEVNCIGGFRGGVCCWGGEDVLDVGEGGKDGGGEVSFCWLSC